MKKVRVIVRLKDAVLDPQGDTVCHALHALGFTEAAGVRIGKFIELTLDQDGGGEALSQRVRAMCDKLLVNPVIEDFEIQEA